MTKTPVAPAIAPVIRPKVHLHQRLLHMLDMGRGMLHQPLALAQISAQGGNLGFRAEAAAQQAIEMQLP